METFLKACGLEGPLVLVAGRRGEPAVERHVLHQPFALLGTDEACDLVLEDPLVAPRHAYLQALGRRVFCADLGSRSGTRLEGGFGQIGWLGPERAIRIGLHRVEVRFKGEAEPGSRRDESPPPPRAVLSRLTLEFDGQAEGPLSWRMKGELALVGRGPQCQVRLLDRAVSRVQCCLLRTPEGAWVVDLLGRGGIAVNGREVRWSPLADGDRLRVGETTITLRCEAAEGPRALPGAGIALPSPAGGLAPATILAGPGWPAIGPARATVPAPTTPAAGAPVEAMLQPIAEQFGALSAQGSGADALLQAMMMMMQVFGTLHREQMDVIRGELEQVRVLTRELTELRRELSEHRPAPPATAPPATAPPATAPPAAEEAPAPGAVPEANGPAPAPLDPLEPGPGAELHDLLCRRIEALQAEQQGRWQRILGTLTGRGRGAAAP